VVDSLLTRHAPFSSASGRYASFYANREQWSGKFAPAISLGAVAAEEVDREGGDEWSSHERGGSRLLRREGSTGAARERKSVVQVPVRRSFISGFIKSFAVPAVHVVINQTAGGMLIRVNGDARADRVNVLLDSLLVPAALHSEHLVDP
jgi:hypothetical protein